MVDEETAFVRRPMFWTHQVGELGADLLMRVPGGILLAQVFGRAVRRIFPVGNVFATAWSRMSPARSGRIASGMVIPVASRKAGAAQQADGAEGFDRRDVVSMATFTVYRKPRLPLSKSGVSAKPPSFVRAIHRRSKVLHLRLWCRSVCCASRARIFSASRRTSSSSSSLSTPLANWKLQATPTR